MPADVQRFFDEYAKAAGGPDPDDLASFLDDQALVTGPKGAVAFHTPAQRRRWAAALLAAHQGNGLQALQPIGVGAYDLGPAFVLATVQWRAFYDRVERPAEPTMTYLLRRAPDGLRVAAVVEHEARDDVLRAAGVVAAGPKRGGAKGARGRPAAQRTRAEAEAEWVRPDGPQAAQQPMPRGPRDPPMRP